MCILGINDTIPLKSSENIKYPNLSNNIRRTEHPRHSTKISYKYEKFQRSLILSFFVLSISQKTDENTKSVCYFERLKKYRKKKRAN